MSIINRFHDIANKVAKVEKEYNHYKGFLEDGTLLGYILITPESKTAFEIEDWQFFNAAFGLIF